MHSGSVNSLIVNKSSNINSYYYFQLVTANNIALLMVFCQKLTCANICQFLTLFSYNVMCV